MKIKDINENGYQLHLIKTNKFKTVLVKALFSDKLKKEDLTARNLLFNNLLFSSAKYDTSRKMAIKREELFSASLYGRNYRRGSQIISEINLSVIADKYCEDGSLKEALEFLFDILNNPNIKDNGFEKESFKVNYERLENSINDENEDPTHYAYKRFKEQIGQSKLYGASTLGTLEDLRKITPESLYAYYKTFNKNNSLDIFIVGDFDFDEVEQVIKDNVKFKYKKSAFVLDEIPYDKTIDLKEEDSKFNQSKIILGGSLENLMNSEKLYEGIVYNIILGNSPNSKLFRNVREKRSLAYNISSSLNRLDNIFYIYAGISLKNREETMEEIQIQLEEMRKGNFSEKEVKNAKEMVLSIMREIDEYPGAMLDHYLNYLYFGNESLAKQKEKIKNIKKEDIIKVAKKIEINTVFLLKEGQVGKDTNK